MSEEKPKKRYAAAAKRGAWKGSLVGLSFVMLGFVVLVLFWAAVATVDENIWDTLSRATQHRAAWRVVGTWCAATAVFCGWGAIIGAIVGLALEAPKR